MEQQPGLQRSESGWSNAYPGVKWRFFDEGEGGWQLSTFPQFETAGSALAQRKGIAAPGSRLLLPLEVAKAAGPLTVHAGRSLGGNSAPQVQFMGYLGIQILLSDYGRTLTAD